MRKNANEIAAVQQDFSRFTAFLETSRRLAFKKRSQRGHDTRSADGGKHSAEKRKRQLFWEAKRREEAVE